MRKILKVEATPCSVLKVTYDNGRTVTYDVTPLIQRGDMFAHLSDKNKFQEVAIGPRGRSLVWPGELDLCADAIWLKATGEKDDTGAIAS
jgi:hypothetical protein